MISAFIAIPLVYVSYRLEGRVDLESRMINTGIQVFGTVIFVAITLLLRKFLNKTLAFHLTDKIIDLMIKINVVIGAVSIISLYVKAIQESMSGFILVIIVIHGILQIVFGYKLLRLPNELNGTLKPYSYINIATGIFLASIVLIPLGLLLGAISDVLLATIFFQASRPTIDITIDG